jgi:hypothetical protein
MLSLALKLGRTVRELERTLSNAELAEWVAYYDVNPWDEWRADLRAGIVASTLANVHSSKKGKFKPRDFMVDFSKRGHREPKTPEQLRQMAIKITAMLGGTVRQ